MLKQNTLILAACLCGLFALSAHADAPPATQPTDSPEVKQVRDQLLEWDKTGSKMSLEEIRKTFHTDNEREATYMDWVAHETWEMCKTEQVIRDKWGPDGDTKFSHLLGSSTLEDDQAADITVDGNHAVVKWSFTGFSPLTLVKVDGHWFNDGHAMFEQQLKNNPNLETERFSTGKLMKQAREDIDAGKFDDADSFIADLKTKLGTPNGN